MNNINYVLIILLLGSLNAYSIESVPQQSTTQSFQSKVKSLFSKPKTWIVLGGAALGTLLFVGAGYVSYSRGLREQELQNLNQSNKKFKERESKPLPQRLTEQKQEEKGAILQLPIEIQRNEIFSRLISSARTEEELERAIARFEGTVTDWYNIVHSDEGKKIINKQLARIHAKKDIQKILNRMISHHYEKGILVEAHDFNDHTPLELYLMERSGNNIKEDDVKFLLGFGSNILRTNKNGDNKLQLIMQSKGNAIPQNIRQLIENAISDKQKHQP